MLLLTSTRWTISESSVAWWQAEGRIDLLRRLELVPDGETLITSQQDRTTTIYKVPARPNGCKRTGTNELTQVPQERGWNKRS